MCTKLFIISLYYVILLSMVCLINCDEEDGLWDGVQDSALAKLVKMRCTRRFSPGVCVDEVVPVWTFVFFAQNCTERLGCPNNYRTNRFRSYRMCMRRCRALVDMYLQMVESEDRNATSGKNNSLEIDAGDKNDTDNIDDDRNLREGFAKYYGTARDLKHETTVNLEGLSKDLDEEEYRQEEQDTKFIVYKDTNVDEDIMPPDVDYVPGEIRSEFDLLHCKLEPLWYIGPSAPLKVEEILSCQQNVEESEESEEERNYNLDDNDVNDN